MNSTDTAMNPLQQPPLNMTFSSTKSYKPRKRKKQRTKIDALSKSLGADAVHDTFFVPYQPPGSAKRDIELVDAARRSYTARRWYRLHEDDATPDESPSGRRTQERQRKVSKVQRDGAKSAMVDLGARPSFRDSDQANKTASHGPRTTKDDEQHGAGHSKAGIHEGYDGSSGPSDDSLQDMSLMPLKSASPWTKFSNFAPYASCSYTIDADAFNAIEYFNRTWAENAFQSATAHRSSGKIGEDEKAMVVRTMMNDDLLAHAFLAAVVMRMAIVHSTHTNAERHANVALAKLRQQLSRSDACQEHLVLPILFLAAYETYCYNIEGTRTHLKALRQLDAQHQLSGYLQRLCRNIDLFSASSSLAPPVLEESLPIRPTPSPPTDSAGDFSDYVSLLGQPLLTTISKIRALALRVEDIRNTTSPSSSEDLATMEIVSTSESLTYELLDHMPGPPLKECNIIALLMWLSYLPASISTSKTPPINHHAVPSNDFLKIIPGRGTASVTRLKQCPLTSGLELWILAVGVVCAVDQDDVEYCATQFARLAERLNVFNVRTALRRFLWLDHFDLIDEDVLTQLLDPETVGEALRTVVGWAAKTRGNRLPTREEKARCVRLTNRPSNFWRLGA